jgi:hypothetical protein
MRHKQKPRPVAGGAAAGALLSGSAATHSPTASARQAARQARAVRRAEYSFALVGRRFAAFDADGALRHEGVVRSIVGEDKALIQLDEPDGTPGVLQIVRLDDLVTVHRDLRWEFWGEQLSGRASTTTAVDAPEDAEPAESDGAGTSTAADGIIARAREGRMP